MKKYSVKLAVILFVWFGLVLCCIFFQPKERSNTERRKLAQFPDITLERVVSGSFMKLFEEYTLDQFPFRDGFRGLSSIFTMYGLKQSDNNGLYIADGYIGKMDCKIDKNSLHNAVEKFTYIYDNYLENCNTYVSIIPDKNYFLAEEKGVLSLDYQAICDYVVEEMPFACYIDIMEQLELSCYYKTDTHWRQERILPVADTLKNGMAVGENKGIQSSSQTGNYDNSKMNWSCDSKYETKLATDEFYGVYYGQLGLPVSPDKLYYLTNNELESCIVNITGEDGQKEVYDMEKLTGNDPYEMFLSGAVPIITVVNPSIDTGKELILFRDSFGSSIAPLLMDAYDKITLVDIRYINSSMLGDYVNFENKDVLFLYSTLLLNSSYTFK